MSYLFVTDKTGEVYVGYISLKTIKTPKKILGHSSYILDVVSIILYFISIFVYVALRDGNVAFSGAINLKRQNSNL